MLREICETIKEIRRIRKEICKIRREICEIIKEIHRIRKEISEQARYMHNKQRSTQKICKKICRIYTHTLFCMQNIRNTQNTQRNTQNTEQYAEYAKKYATPIWNTQNHDKCVFCIFYIRTYIHTPTLLKTMHHAEYEKGMCDRGCPVSAWQISNGFCKLKTLESSGCDSLRQNNVKFVLLFYTAGL